MGTLMRILKSSIDMEENKFFDSGQLIYAGSLLIELIQVYIIYDFSFYMRISFLFFFFAKVPCLTPLLYINFFLNERGLFTCHRSFWSPSLI